MKYMQITRHMHICMWSSLHRGLKSVCVSESTRRGYWVAYLLVLLYLTLLQHNDILRQHYTLRLYIASVWPRLGLGGTPLYTAPHYQLYRGTPRVKHS